MKQALLGCAVLFLLSVASKAQETVGAPYNPDSNADSLINALDVLSIIPLYGQEFLPSQDDLDSTNEIQSLYISNDTLYLVPNGGFIFLGDIAPQINLDSLVSSLSVDSTLLANVGGIGSGGCDFNFPEKGSLNLVHHSFNDSGDYTVPLDKHLYVLGEVFWNGNLSGSTGAFKPSTGMPVIFYGGQTLQDSDDNGSFHGYLIEASSDIFPVHHSFNDSGDYTVPLDMNLYVLGDVFWNGELSGSTGPYKPNSGMPAIFSGGQILQDSDGNGSFQGYLVNESYFDGCGGFGSQQQASENIGFNPQELVCTGYGGNPDIPLCEWENEYDEACILPWFEAFKFWEWDENETECSRVSWRTFSLSGSGFEGVTHMVVTHPYFDPFSSQVTDQAWFGGVNVISNEELQFSISVSGQNWSGISGVGIPANSASFFPSQSELFYEVYFIKNSIWYEASFALRMSIQD